VLGELPAAGVPLPRRITRRCRLRLGSSCWTRCSSGSTATTAGRCFALLSTLDLDLVLTSDREWCTYPELSGVAIHQLVTGDDGDDEVTTTRFVRSFSSCAQRCLG
jgi:hypothetical protein